MRQLGPVNTDFPPDTMILLDFGELTNPKMAPFVHPQKILNLVHKTAMDSLIGFRLNELRRQRKNTQNPCMQKILLQINHALFGILLCFSALYIANKSFYVNLWAEGTYGVHG